MAINARIYKNGVRGLLSHYEIDTLPYDYEIYKSMFHDATTRKEDKNNKKKVFSIMNFGIDMTKVVKVVVEKNDHSFIEYDIKDGVIVDASIIEKEKTVEEKVEELKNDPEVKKVNTLIKLSDNAGVLTKMAETNKSLTECIKDSVKNEPINIEDPVLNRTPNEDAKAIFSSAIVGSAKIMKENEKMDETAKDFREVIAEKLSDEKTDKESLKVDNDIDKALTISDREKRIEYLKDVISKINKKDE